MLNREDKLLLKLWSHPLAERFDEYEVIENGKSGYFRRTELVNRSFLQTEKSTSK
jgi:hypothetical protein